MASATNELPAYTVRAFQEKHHRYCICVFVLNEGKRIQAQLAKMTGLASLCDIVVVDGGSTDGALTPELLQRCGVTKLITKVGPGGLSAQMRIAFADMLGEDYEGIVVVDGNDKDDVSAAPRFLDALMAGYDHVQGSRFIVGGSHLNTPAIRLWALRFIHVPLMRLFSGFGYTDTTNGFRAYSSRFLMDPRVQPLRHIFSKYELHYYLAIRAPELGFKTVEVPVTRNYPLLGKTPSKISPLKGNILILITLLKACFRCFNP